MSLFIYPESWNEEKTKLAEEIVDLVSNSQLNIFDVCYVLNDMSERFDDIARRSGVLFSATEVMPRVEAEIIKTHPELPCMLGRSVQKIHVKENEGEDNDE